MWDRREAVRTSLAELDVRKPSPSLNSATCISDLLFNYKIKLESHDPCGFFENASSTQTKIP